MSGPEKALLPWVGLFDSFDSPCHWLEGFGQFDGCYFRDSEDRPAGYIQAYCPYRRAVVLIKLEDCYERR